MNNALFPISIWAYVACFFLTFYFLKRRTTVFDTFFIASATTISGAWLYETTYNYMWGFNGLANDLSAPRVTFGLGLPFPIYFAIFLILLPLLSRQYISVNRSLLIVSLVSIILIFIWYEIGFPQFWCVCSHEPIWGVWLPRTSVEPLGWIMNSLTKLLVIVPAFLFYPKKTTSQKPSQRF
jgi:hypothetical protein